MIVTYRATLRSDSSSPPTRVQIVVAARDVSQAKEMARQQAYQTNPEHFPEEWEVEHCAPVRARTR